jgi:hypothetical protein
LAHRDEGKKASGWRYSGGMLKLNSDGKEENAARQDRQVLVKARRSWNELRREIIS